MSGHERRGHPRFASINLVQFTHFDDQYRKDLANVGRTLDLSEGGLLMESSYPLTNGSQVEVDIAINEEIVTVRGEVVHVKPGNGIADIGIQFSLISKKDKELINDFLKDLNAGPSVLDEIISDLDNGTRG